MKKVLTLILVFIMVFTMLTALAEEKNMLSREDIPLYNGGGLDRIGILKGTENGFELEREVTRAEAITFIKRTLAMDDEDSETSPFTDVKGHWAEKTVDLFYEKGYVDGVSETQFAPDRNVTGREFTKILLSAMGYSGITLENALEKGTEYDVLSNNFTKSVVKQNFTLLRSDVLRIVHSALSSKCADGVMTYEKHIEKGLLKREDFEGVLWCGTPAAKSLSFADKFYNEIESDESYMVSPFSVKIALLLLANGAEGETKEEILSLLGVENLTEYNEEMKILTEKYAKSRSFTLNSANSVWMNKDNTNQDFSDTYKETVSNYYGAEVMETDNKTAVKTVNDWVSDKTNGKIKSLIQKPDFYALLVNAVYFKASWQNEFNKGATYKDTFHGKAGDREEDFMRRTGYMNVFYNDGLKILELPYKNRVEEADENGMFMGAYSEDINISMYILMGDDRVSDADSLISDEELKSTYVSLYLPKFETETTLNLTDILKSMGMKVSFTEAADLTKMCDSGNMQVTDGIHKTYIKVDEKGTEAAAVTGMMAGATSAKPPVPIEFKFDKPFTYVIKDKTSGEVLFIGEYK